MDKQICKGSRDLPIETEKEDLFGLGNYYQGIADFISRCETPLTVAIQGDWGSGKTSMMNNIEKKLDNCCVIRFDTWQYALLNNSVGLIDAFMNNITESIVNELRESGMLENAQYGLVNALKNILKMFHLSSKMELVGNVCVGLEMNLDEFLKNEKSYYDSIRMFKKLFEEQVEALLKKKGKERIVIFIDDLDRLAPSRAVELLEIIKVFLDVRGCVFVLAIDYEVVILGVRQKYGEDLMYQKGKSFFDKMIQLPFQIPVSLYKMDKMMEKAFQDMGITMGESSRVAELVKESVGTNPRTVKRLLNSFELLHDILNIEAGEDKEEKNLFLLFILIIQLYNEPLYNYLISSPGWRKEYDGEDTIFSYQLKLEGENEEEYFARLFGLNAQQCKELDVRMNRKFIGMMDSLLGEEKIARETNMELFYNLLIQSQITASSQREKTTSFYVELSNDLNISSYMILGVLIEGYEEIPVDNFTGAFVQTIQTVVTREEFINFVNDKKRRAAAGLPDRMFDRLDNGDNQTKQKDYGYTTSSIKYIHDYPIVLHYGRKDLEKHLLKMLKGLGVKKKIMLRVEDM